jgi:hypothetical protein
VTDEEIRALVAAHLAEPPDCGDRKGTDAGYQRHRYWGSRPCSECCAAHREYNEAHRARKAPPELKPCGTTAAYRRHIRKRQVPCEACVVAHRLEVRKYTKPRAERGGGRVRLPKTGGRRAA